MSWVHTLGLLNPIGSHALVLIAYICWNLWELMPCIRCVKAEGILWSVNVRFKCQSRRYLMVCERTFCVSKPKVSNFLRTYVLCVKAEGILWPANVRFVCQSRRYLMVCERTFCVSKRKISYGLRTYVLSALWMLVVRVKTEGVLCTVNVDCVCQNRRGLMHCESWLYVSKPKWSYALWMLVVRVKTEGVLCAVNIGCACQNRRGLMRCEYWLCVSKPYCS